MLNGYDVVESIKEQVLKMKATYESERKAILNLCDPIDEEYKIRYQKLIIKIDTLDRILYAIDTTVDNFRRID